MKKIFSIALLITFSFKLFAWVSIDSLAKKHRLGINKRYGIISGGPYIQVGLGFPKGEIKQLEEPYLVDQSKLGQQYSIEVGFQKMFYKSKSRRIGVGLNLSLGTYGKSSYVPTEAPTDTYIVKSYGFCGLGPMGSIAINKRMAIDVFINLMPSLQKGTRISTVNSGLLTTTTISKANGLGGLIVPGIRFRFSIVSVGFEYQYAEIKLPVSIAYSVNTPLGLVNGTYNGNALNKLFLPRFTLGIKL